MGQLNNGMAGMNLSNFALGNFGNEGYLSDASEINRGRSPRGRRGSSKPPEDPTDIALLRDIPNWLRTLRLHKYTDNLKDMNWQDLVALDDEGLTAKGVAAKGARTKLLKVCPSLREAKQSLLLMFRRYLSKSSKPNKKAASRDGFLTDVVVLASTGLVSLRREDIFFAAERCGPWTT